MKKYQVTYPISRITFDAEDMEDAIEKCREYGIELDDETYIEEVL